MLLNQTPPQEVIELVRLYQSDPTHYELIIHDNMFLLHELSLVSPKEGEPTQVILGPVVRRAYWRDAAGLGLEIIKSRLGLR